MSQDDQRTGVQHIEIDEELAGQRLDNFLIKTLKGLPKSRIYRIIRKGEVRINGKRCKPDTRLNGGDKVRVPPITHLKERKDSVGSFNDELGLVLFENADLLVINKPAGMAVHGGSGISTGVIETLRHTREEGDRLELVHRLDRGTSGCLMVAKKRSYLRLLQDALRRQGEIKKTYLALVHGEWPDHLKLVDQPLLTMSQDGREKITRIHPSGKSSVTRFRPLKRNNGLSLVEARPLTGRTHQIRAHARWARHPLVGDDRYGSKALDAGVGIGSSRLMLHAISLEIPPLGDRAGINIEAPIPKEFSSQVDANL